MNESPLCHNGADRSPLLAGCSVRTQRFSGDRRGAGGQGRVPSPLRIQTFPTDAWRHRRLRNRSAGISLFGRNWLYLRNHRAPPAVIGDWERCAPAPTKEAVRCQIEPNPISVS